MFFHQTEQFLGTNMDEKAHLDRITKDKVVELSVVAAQVAGQMALRLVHDHILKLDVTKYSDVIAGHVSAIIKRVDALKFGKVILFAICILFAMRNNTKNLILNVLLTGVFFN